MTSLLVVDSGTTTTRVRLLLEGRVRRTVWAPVGAATTSVCGNTKRLEEALAGLVRQVRTEALAADEPLPRAVICSGMITSNVGLFQVTHLEAPATIDRLAAGIVRRDFADISDLPIYFVPGVKTIGESLPDCDVLRGEEVECIGLLRALDLDEPVVFMHFGSHSKAIDTDGTGTVVASRTSLTGELLAATLQNTILASSTIELDEVQLDMESWTQGLTTAREHGFGRALFLVRVGEQIAGRSREQMTNFLLGAFASLDLTLLSDAIGSRRMIVLYGRGVQKAALDEYLRSQGHGSVRVVDDELTETAAAIGAGFLYERHLEMNAADSRGQS